MTEIYADSWVWYVPTDVEEHARKLDESMPKNMNRRVLIKAGGQGFTWQQWSPDRIQPYINRNISPIAWVYYTTDETDDDVCLNTLRKHPSAELILNVEIEWSYAYGITDDYVTARIDNLRRKLAAAGFHIPIGFSSVASWNWFPYAAFSKACDGTEQIQAYWKPHRADQIWPLSQKSRAGAKIVVGLPACLNEDAGGDDQIWTEQGIEDLADYYATGTRDLVGFNGWQSGATDRGNPARPDYAYDAMTYAYSLLPDYSTQLPEKPVDPQPSVSLNLPYNVSNDPAVWHCLLPDGSLDVWVIQSQFLEKYQSVGNRGLELFGLPISGMYIDPFGKAVQYFERARFELAADGVVDLGRVGAESLELKNIITQSSNGMLSASSVQG